MSKFRGYWAFFSSALQAHLAYSGSLLMSLGASAISYLITIMIWNYAMKDRAMAHELFVYLTVVFILGYVTNLFLERTIGERIREGLVATDLLKPVDFQLFYMVQSLSDLMYQGILALLVLGLGLIFLGQDLLPPTPQAAFWGVLSIGLAFFVQFGICFIFVQGIFLTNSNYGIMASRQALTQAFSGVFAPLTLYPSGFRMLAEALPFRHVIYTPAAVYLGRVQGAELKDLLLQQALWACCLLLAGRMIFNRVLAKLAIQGG